MHVSSRLCPSLGEVDGNVWGLLGVVIKGLRICGSCGGICSGSMAPSSILSSRLSTYFGHGYYCWSILFYQIY